MTIVGELLTNAGVICYGKPSKLTVVSIGPVQSYQWFKKIGGTWSPLAGEIDAIYEIPSATDADKGLYKVEINNGFCNLKSEIEVKDVIKTEKPSISLNATCIGGVGTNTLTAITTEPSPIIQWYKDGVFILGNNTTTLPNAKAGEYKVIVIPQGLCPSEYSDPITVTDIWCAEILLLNPCSFNPKLSLSSQTATATYRWLYSSDNGVNWNSISTDTEIETTKEGLYKIEKLDNGDLFYTKPVKFVIKQKKKVNNRWWYEILLQ